MSGDTARIVLERLVARLTPLVGEASHADFAYWEGDEAAALDRGRGKSGWFKLATALLDARDALASDDPGRIEQAALRCPPFEREGLKRRHEYETIEKRRKGGKHTGRLQTEAAQSRYAPWKKRYRELIDKGKTPGTARFIVRAEMLNAEDWAGDGQGQPVPSTRTLSKWLR